MTFRDITRSSSSMDLQALRERNKEIETRIDDLVSKLKSVEMNVEKRNSKSDHSKDKITSFTKGKSTKKQSTTKQITSVSSKSTSSQIESIHSSDERVQATNDDSIVSKRNKIQFRHEKNIYIIGVLQIWPSVICCSSYLTKFQKKTRKKGSASRAGYMEDEYLRYFVDKPAKRSALINRGYYIRCSAIRGVIRRFLQVVEPRGPEKTPSGFRISRFLAFH